MHTSMCVINAYKFCLSIWLGWSCQRQWWEVHHQQCLKVIVSCQVMKLQPLLMKKLPVDKSLPWSWILSLLWILAWLCILMVVNTLFACSNNAQKSYSKNNLSTTWIISVSLILYSYFLIVLLVHNPKALQSVQPLPRYAYEFQNLQSAKSIISFIFSVCFLADCWCTVRMLSYNNYFLPKLYIYVPM